MTSSGWIFMICSIGFVLGLISFCFSRILRKPVPTDQLHSTITIEPVDEPGIPD